MITIIFKQQEPYMILTIMSIEYETADDFCPAYTTIKAYNNGNLKEYVFEGLLDIPSIIKALGEKLFPYEVINL